jgi:hypothetical protein
MAGAGETSPPAFAASYLRRSSRTLFVFSFERDPHGLFLGRFQKARLLSCKFLAKQVVQGCGDGLGDGDQEGRFLSILPRAFEQFC